MMEYFIGVDPGQINQGIAIIDKNLKIIDMFDVGVKFPKDCRGKDVPDIVKNSYVYYKTKAAVEKVGSGNIKMCVMEGANYSTQSNVTPISIGSIHGQNQIYFWDQKIDFMILPPRTIQVGVHDTSVDITKQKTKEKMREIFKKQIPEKGFTSNMSDALGMAYLARQFYLLMTDKVELSIGQQKIFLGKTKIKGRKRGVVYNFGQKLFIFDKYGKMQIPLQGEALTHFYERVKVE